MIDWDNILQNNKNKFEFVQIEKPPEDGTVLTAEEARKYFDDAIRNLDLSEWKVVVEGDDSTLIKFDINQLEQKARIPNDRNLLKRNSVLNTTKIMGLIAHELGVHAMRRQKGERSKLQLLGIGLDRYITGEEGLATYKQQQVEGAKDFFGESGHFAVSIALGLDGRKRTFREVFEILKRFSILLKKESVDRETTSGQMAWKKCVDIYRGTTCKTPGAIYAKSMVYREGNIGIWNLVNTNSDEQHRFMVGKYDPTNDRHIYILDQLGISEKDLGELES